VTSRPALTHVRHSGNPGGDINTKPTATVRSGSGDVGV
jgi:hypothetical protein